jgi:hypothetical protein
MNEINKETSYFLLRARQEQEQAKQAEKPEAAAVHRELAMRYSVKALQVQVEDAEAAGDESAN